MEPYSDQAASRVIEPASQLDPSQHEIELMEMLDLPLTFDLLDYVVDCVVSAFSCTSCFTSAQSRIDTASLLDLVTVLAYHPTLDVDMCVIVVALSYVDKWGREWHDESPGHWSCETVFLIALLLAMKYVKERRQNLNVWASCLDSFEAKDVARTERDFLRVIAYDLRIRDEDLLAHRDAVIQRCASPDMSASSPLSTLPISVVSLPISKSMFALQDLETTSPDWDPLFFARTTPLPDSPSIETPEWAKHVMTVRLCGPSATITDDTCLYNRPFASPNTSLLLAMRAKHTVAGCRSPEYASLYTHELVSGSPWLPLSTASALTRKNDDADLAYPAVTATRIYACNLDSPDSSSQHALNCRSSPSTWDTIPRSLARLHV